VRQAQRGGCVTDTRADWLERYGRLTVALVSDALDSIGLRQQTLAPGMFLADPDRPVIGFAFPMRAEGTQVLAAEPYKRQFEAMEACQPGDVFTVATDGTPSAFWGELLSTRLQAKGCRGAVVDGLARDQRGIREIGFPLMVRGFHPADSYGRLEIVRYGEPEVVAGVSVSRGDLLFGDVDGAVAVPQAVALEVLERAEAKQRAEAGVREALRSGERVDQVYRRFGVM
jgi:4-hydroxy-4-methyl-2-oxoglutarate aldolase